MAKVLDRVWRKRAVPARWWGKEGEKRKGAGRWHPEGALATSSLGLT